MSFKEYEKKRNLSLSKEPSAKVKKTTSKNPTAKEKSSPAVKSSSDKLIFVVHEHHARNLHWDLRLEMEGALKSWAVPKEPPTEKGTKRLAIQVEDHPLEYADFHGTIPEGNYGAGEVKIWDKGNYEILKKYPKKIIFELHGKKLKGKYCLVKANFHNQKSWLFFKMEK
jgi:DNA ligase D-like protein (predicted 3'-phosphoesterase)